MSDEPIHVAVLREMTAARARGMTDGQYLQMKLGLKPPQPQRQLPDRAPPTQLIDEAEARRTGRTLREIYAACGTTPLRVAEDKQRRRATLTHAQKTDARVQLFDLVCRIHTEPQTVTEIVKRAAIALGISDDEPTLPELTDHERRYCLDEAVLFVLADPDAPPATADASAAFALAVDIHYERICLGLRWSRATPDQRGPVIRRSIMRRMGL